MQRGSVPCHPVTDSAHSSGWRKVFSEHQHPMGTVRKTEPDSAVLAVTGQGTTRQFDLKDSLQT